MADSRAIFSDYNSDQSLENDARWYVLLDSQPLACTKLDISATHNAQDMAYCVENILPHFEARDNGSKNKTHRARVLGEWYSADDTHASQWAPHEDQTELWFLDAWSDDYDVMHPHLVTVEAHRATEIFMANLHHQPPEPPRVNKPSYWKYQATNDHALLSANFTPNQMWNKQPAPLIGITSPFKLAVFYAAARPDGLARVSLLEYVHDPDRGGFVKQDELDDGTHVFKREVQSASWRLLVTAKLTEKGGRDYEVTDVKFEATPRSVITMLNKPIDVIHEHM